MPNGIKGSTPVVVASCWVEVNVHAFYPLPSVGGSVLMEDGWALYIKGMTSVECMFWKICIVFRAVFNKTLILSLDAI